MKPYEIAIPSDRKQTFYDQDGNIIYEVLDRPTGLFRSLVGGQTVRGDHSTPMSFTYNQRTYTALEGSNGAYVPDTGELDFTVEGNSGYYVYPYSQLDDTTVYNNTLSQINDQVRAGIDWSVTAGQSKQVGSMVSNAAKVVRHVRDAANRMDLWSAYQAYQRFHRSGRRGTRAMKQLGDKWLEFQYGWKPLAQDIYNTAVELGRDFPSLMKAEAKSTNRDNFTESSNFFGIPRQDDITRSVRCYMKVRFTPNSSTLSLLSNFTSLNPASIAWELTPYSFVVDWFVDVGGYMRNLESSLLSLPNFRDGFVTTTWLSHRYCYIAGTAPIPERGLMRFANLSGYCRDVAFYRLRLYQMPMPRPPVFRAALGSGRLLNAAALMTTFMKK